MPILFLLLFTKLITILDLNKFVFAMCEDFKLIWDYFRINLQYIADSIYEDKCNKNNY